MQDWQLTATVVALLSPQKLERGAAAPLVNCACVAVLGLPVFKPQLAAAMPGIEALHAPTLGARAAMTCSNQHQIKADGWAGSG